MRIYSFLRFLALISVNVFRLAIDGMGDFSEVLASLEVGMEFQYQDDEWVLRMQPMGAIIRQISLRHFRMPKIFLSLIRK